MTTIGSLCTGYGGLDLAVGGTTAWLSEIDPHASKICATRFPDAPNLGDLTAIDWADIEPVDVVTAGYPCQPFSMAGKRKGLNDERHIWPNIADAIRVLRPRYAFLENVPGHIGLGFDRVLADLAEIGFDARWGTLRASDVGAAHRRERLFIVATNTDYAASDRQRPRTQPHQRGSAPDAGDEKQRQPAVRGLRGESGGSAPDVDGIALIPTPTASDGAKGGPNQAGSKGDLRVSSWAHRTDETWGDYAPAIHRWGIVLGRPAPAPLQTSRTGRRVLAPRFVEWLMGLPEGWVTDIDISRVQQLKALGNGVVPQQAVAALDALTHVEAAA